MSDNSLAQSFSDAEIADLLETTIFRLESRCDANKNFAIGEPFAKAMIFEMREAARRLRSARSETPQPEGLAKYIGNRKPENTAPETAQPPASEAVARRYLKALCDSFGPSEGVTLNSDTWRHARQHILALLRADGGTTKGDTATVPLEPTREMIEAGAQRLVRWETGKEQWPDAWDKLSVRASRNDAERVWRSMWLAATGGKLDAS